jgi:hypothetical protein
VRLLTVRYGNGTVSDCGLHSIMLALREASNRFLYYQYAFALISFFIAQRPFCICCWNFFIFFFLLNFCTQVIMPKASAYGDEIWQVDSLSKGADRTFISLKSHKGFSSGGTTYQNTFHTFLHSSHTTIAHRGSASNTED